VSYSVKLRVSEGVVVPEISGLVPDGTITVSGHDDDEKHVLSVTRQGPDGRYVAAASHTHYKGQ
jgi:hypothetical protein